MPPALNVGDRRSRKADCISQLLLREAGLLPGTSYNGSGSALFGGDFA